jgi:ATP-binding cassette subfamily C (CFTR/MRP) protein 1
LREEIDNDDDSDENTNMPSPLEPSYAEFGAGDLELSSMPVPRGCHTPLIKLEAATVAVKPDNKVILDHVDMTFLPATLTCLVGSVGSGKSTLLRAILGDVKLTTGRRLAPTGARDFAFCAQDAWLPNGTVKTAVRGLSGFDEEWYNSVILACGLASDIDSFPAGDNTIVGSKGYSLSGGQRQRLALARALYSRKKILVLDDVTSGLDADLSKRVAQSLKAFCRNHGVTVVAATHSVHHLRYSDHIVAMGQHGKISEQGSLADLTAQDGYVRSLRLGTDTEHGETAKPKQPENAPPPSAEPVVAHGADGDAQAELARRTGDFSVYKHYAASVGWK